MLWPLPEGYAGMHDSVRGILPRHCGHLMVKLAVWDFEALNTVLLCTAWVQAVRLLCR
jgi:hypothetical protein